MTMHEYKCTNCDIEEERNVAHEYRDTQVCFFCNRHLERLVRLYKKLETQREVVNANNTITQELQSASGT